MKDWIMFWLARILLIGRHTTATMVIENADLEGSFKETYDDLRICMTINLIKRAMGLPSHGALRPRRWLWEAFSPHITMVVTPGNATYGVRAFVKDHRWQDDVQWSVN